MSMRKYFHFVYVIAFIIGSSSCVTASTDNSGDTLRRELIENCNVLLKAMNRIVDVNTDFIDYNNAVNHYAETGRYDEYIDFNPSAAQNYFDGYEKSSKELKDLRASLYPSTLFMKNQIDVAISLLENYWSFITFYDNNSTLINRELWENRRVGINELGSEINNFCKS